MNARLQKVRRIGHLQQRLRDLSLWRLSALDQQRDQLSDARAEMLRAMSDGLFAFGSAAAAASRRICAIEMELENANSVHELQSRQALEHGVRLQLALAALRAVTEQSVRNRQSHELAEAIEKMSHASGSASRKP
jgi:hypothetical protein